MKVGILVFPGSNCDRDLADAFKLVGAQVEMIWHKETALLWIRFDWGARWIFIR